MMAAYLAGDNPSHPSALAASAQEFRMKIEKDRVVRFHYTVAEQGQEPIESSRDRDPLAILIGHGNIIPGLEAAMLDKEAGASFEVDVKAADAYGERKEGLSQRVPKKHFGDTRLVKGQQVVLQTNFGPPPYEATARFGGPLRICSPEMPGGLRAAAAYCPPCQASRP